MVDYFDSIYFSVVDRNIFLSKIRYYSLLRFLIRLIANMLLSIAFRSTQSKDNNSLKSKQNTEVRIIVSLTTFPRRINRLWLVIETLLRQTRRPDKIILWLSKEQFKNIQSLPKNLIRLQKRGLEIRFCEDDLRSHKKYYYAMKEFPDDIIVTVDDDVLYHSELLENLLKLNRRFPDVICCNHASRIAIENGKIAPYINWSNIDLAENPTDEIMPIGIGGVLYPPHSLSQEVFNADLFKESCFYADDIWLNIMARLNGTLVAKTAYNSFYLPVLNFNDKTLASINVNEGLNDIQLNAIGNYCKDNLSRDPFTSLLVKRSNSLASG